MATQIPGSVFTAGRVLQSRYRLDEPVAVGGMAEVWRGHDLVLQRSVAIKLLHPHLAADENVIERFRREAISAARLSHPNIVPTYDAGTDEGTTYIVLGLVQGPTLADVMRVRKLTPFQAAVIAEQVADALEHAHKKGLIHRDIKPANVLVVDDEHRVMVADFGIAKAVAETTDASLTLPGLVVGTPAYVAPEQLAGKEATVQSDVYSLGVMLHEMLCGHTATDVVTQLSVAGEVDPTSWKCPDLPKGLDVIVEQAANPEPEARFASAAEMRDSLAAFQQSLTPAVKHQERRVPRPQTQSTSGGQHTTVQPTVAPQPAYDASAAQKSARRRYVASAVVAVLLVAGAIAFGRVIGSMDSETPSTTSVTTPISITNAHSFDPEGDDNVENESSAKLVFDGNPATSWSTSGYTSRTFGSLKDGVGIYVDTSTSAKLKQLQVDSNSQNWAASVYVADEPATELSGWGSVVDTKAADGQTTTFDLKQIAGKNVLLWITDLGDANKVTISELRLSS